MALDEVVVEVTDGGEVLLLGADRHGSWGMLLAKPREGGKRLDVAGDVPGCRGCDRETECFEVSHKPANRSGIRDPGERPDTDDELLPSEAFPGGGQLWWANGVCLLVVRTRRWIHSKRHGGPLVVRLSRRFIVHDRERPFSVMLHRTAWIGWQAGGDRSPEPSRRRALAHFALLNRIDRSVLGEGTPASVGHLDAACQRTHGVEAQAAQGMDRL